ncbi:MAG TPA: hypothetical protein VFT42_07270 [Solirubrobacteraceae bacterium]|nr:hypothetical protein [Solirubrobacteraceae bacterium]
MSADPRTPSERGARAGQVALGLLWLTDGALQFQPYMFGRSFVTGIILPSAAGQPGVIAGPITWIARLIEPHVAVFNAGAATLQVLIGLGLLYRPSVKAALLASFAWAGGIWFAGEGLGMIFTGTASPLTGAPGAAPMYIVAGLLCWPAAGRRIRLAGRGCWSLVWLLSAVLWLLPANRGDGLPALVAVGLAVLSAAIAFSLPARYHARLFLVLAILISLSFWIAGQDPGGTFSGQATDVGTAPLMALIAALLLAREPSAPPRVPKGLPARASRRSLTPGAAGSSG